MLHQHKHLLLKKSDDPISDNAKQILAEGKQTFRFETFGDETTEQLISLKM